MLDPTPSQPNDPLIGKLIVASSIVQDAVLSRSVSLVVHQDTENIFAVLLNRPMTPPPGFEKLIRGDGPKETPGATDARGTTNRFGDLSESTADEGDRDEPAGPYDAAEYAAAEQDAGESFDAADRAIAEVSKALGLIHFGGPMSGPVVAVHNSREHAEAEAGRGVYVAAQKEALETLIRQKPGSYRLIVGHLGWTRDQFRSEREAGYWHLIDATDDNVFAVDQDLWPGLIRRATTRSVAQWMGIPDTPFAAEVN